uniref:Uncharacterized protein n=1 Tax=Lygus hesperus TaxID=30085 RepID=A0A0A9YMQ5_LYGHE
MKKLLLGSLINTTHPQFQTIRKLYKNSHIYWLMFASQLFFHLKVDRGWESVEEQILKLFGFLKFTEEDIKEIEVNKELWQRVVSISHENLKAMHKEIIGKRRKGRKIRTKYHSDKVFHRYMYNWKMSHYGRCGKPKKKKPIRREPSVMKKDSTSKVAKYEDTSLHRVIDYRGKSDYINIKPFHRKDFDMRIHDIMSKYELSHLIGKDPGNMKKKINFKRIKKDVVEMWDSKSNNSLLTFQRIINNKLLYWYGKHVQTRDAMIMMQTQIDNALTTKKNLRQALSAPLLLLDNDDPIDLENSRIWNGPTNINIMQNLKDDAWAHDDEYDTCTTVTTAGASHKKRRRKKIRMEKRAAKNRRGSTRVHMNLTTCTTEHFTTEIY